MRTKTRYQAEVVSELYDAVIKLITATCATVTINSRWLGIARLVLSTYREELLPIKTLCFPQYWKLFHDALDRCMRLEYDGNMRASNLSLVAELCKQVWLHHGRINCVRLSEYVSHSSSGRSYMYSYPVSTCVHAWLPFNFTKHDTRHNVQNVHVRR